MSKRARRIWRVAKWMGMALWLPFVLAAALCSTTYVVRQPIVIRRTPTVAVVFGRGKLGIIRSDYVRAVLGMNKIRRFYGEAVESKTDEGDVTDADIAELAESSVRRFGKPPPGKRYWLWWNDVSNQWAALHIFSGRITAVTSIPPLAVVARWWFLRNRRARRKRGGFCQHCGYDLTGNVSGVCPECGQGIR